MEIRRLSGEAAAALASLVSARASDSAVAGKDALWKQQPDAHRFAFIEPATVLDAKSTVMARPGSLWLVDKSGTPTPAVASAPIDPGDLRVPADVVRVLPVAIARMREAKRPLANYTVKHEIDSTEVTILFVPRREPEKGYTEVGGRTSLGEEVHYRFDRVTGAFAGENFAR